MRIAELKHLSRLAVTSLFVAWCFDQLFWQKVPGVSFLIFSLLCLGAGFYLTWSEGSKPAWTSLLLVLPVLFFSAMTFFRLEPFTLFVDYTLALGGMVVIALTWLGGRWWQYSLSDYIVNGVRLALFALVQPFGVFFRRRGDATPLTTDQAGDPPLEQSRPARQRSAIALSLSFGMAMALPIIVILAVLLANADPIFNRRVEEFLRLLNIEKLDEYIVRLIYIFMLAYGLCGSYLYALLSSRQEKLVGREKPWLSPFLGWIEALTILVSVDLLFASFVIVQFQYFFGGQANIRVEGFTYADYARRGFGELVAVAVISLLLFLALGTFTRREAAKPRRFFSALGIVLVGLVSVILVSAFQRLLLYESAYGFSRLRAYTHVFMVWLGILLLATALLEGLGRLRDFALAATLAVLGFGITMNLINVDAYIASQNIVRSSWGAKLDTAYLASLSDDAVPAMFDSLHSASLPSVLRQEIGGALACRTAIQPAPSPNQPWQSTHWSRQRAARLYGAYQGELVAFPLKLTDGTWAVQVNGAWHPCEAYYRD